MARFGAGLDARDHAWLHELVYGTFRLRGRLDHVLSAFVRGGLGSLDPEVLDVLRLGTYQLREMGGVPAYAAVSQSVELTRSAGKGRAAGLVNGVLQNVARRGDQVDFPEFDADPVEHLITWGSHPRWLVERWMERWGAGDARALVEADNRIPELYLRPVGLEVDEALRRLAEGGVSAQPVLRFPDSIRLASSGDLADALRLVPAVVQDPSAAIVARYAAFDPGAVVLDLSAAPGGTTVGLAESAAYVVASDLSFGRLRRVRANVERTATADRVGLAVADGRAPPFRPAAGALVDAPCSGTGTLRRHPDGRWRLGPVDIRALQALQRELLVAAARLVHPGGLLVYATCSLEPEENEDQVSWFLGGDAEFREEPTPAAVDDSLLAAGRLRVLPQHHEVDGAFAVRLRRIA